VSLCLTAEQIECMAQHARQCVPEECCGVLLGQRRGEHGLVDEVISTGNRGDRPTRTYEIDVADLLRAAKRARRRGRRIIGFYHSHPDGTPTPSALDIELTWPNTSYVILGLNEQQGLTMRSWMVSMANTVPQQEGICVRDTVSCERNQAGQADVGNPAGPRFHRAAPAREGPSDSAGSQRR
jgi:proteasome lid subunit RPN8/RPN11